MIGRVSSPLFVGRREELAVLEDAVTAAAGATGTVVLVGGEAGVGKSRLLAELDGLLDSMGATMAIGGCLPIVDGDLPYAPIVTALRSLARSRDALNLIASDGLPHDELARLLPELSTEGTWTGQGESSPGVASARLFEQLLAVLVRMARQSPIVLAVEDLHWSDRATRDFLTFLARGIRREPVALILTYRDDEIDRRHPARHFLLELERSGQATRLKLSGFGLAELREQAKSILDREPSVKLLHSLMDRAEGNPFFTEELLTTVDLSEATLPESLREAMLFRIEGSSELVQTVLRVAAVAGRAIDHALLTAVIDADARELLDAVRDAVRSYLLVEDAGTGAYSFRHALLREAVYEDLLMEERRSLHLELARALGKFIDLADARAASGELAHHWYAARHLPEALDASIDAGLQADHFRAPSDAMAHYQRALELWDTVAPPAPRLSRIEVLQRAGAAALQAGENDHALQFARETIERIDPGDHVALSMAHERLGRYLWVSGRGEEAVPELRQAVALMPESVSRERAFVLAAEAQVLMLCNENELSERRCDEALRIATDVGAEDIKAHVLNTMCGNYCYSGRFEEGVTAAREALEIARRLGVYDEIGRSFVNGSDALDQAGRVGESIAFAREGLKVVAANGGDRIHGDFLRAEIAGRLIRTGAWAEAEDLLAELSERASLGVNAGMLFQNLAEISSERGDYAAALRAVERAYENIATANGSMWLAPVAAAQATAELWNGDPAAAIRTITERMDRLGPGEYTHATAALYELGTRAHADLCELAPGDEAVRTREMAAARDLLRRLDQRLAELAGRPPRRALLGRALAAAECSRITGPDPSAWQEAERLAETNEDIYRLAYARWRHAEALIQTDGGERAVQDLVQQALCVARQLRARPLEQALEALMRAARLTPVTDEPATARGEHGLDRFDLTPRELEVLALLGEGMSNREIAATLVISDKTASVHVSRILAKLSVANRARAAVMAQRLSVIRPER